MRPVKTKEVESLLKEKGFKFDRQNGSHMTYKDSSGKTVTIVNSREQSPGVLRQLKNMIGLNFR